MPGVNGLTIKIYSGNVPIFGDFKIRLLYFRWRVVYCIQKSFRSREDCCSQISNIKKETISKFPDLQKNRKQLFLNLLKFSVYFNYHLWKTK